MKDIQIIELLFQRAEEAITRLVEKYGAMCQAIARRILWDERDSEECVNDTWVQTWNTIPPQRPAYLGGFVGRITRNLALNRLDHNRAQKRNFTLEETFWELSDSLPDPGERVTDEVAFHDFLDRFLRRQSVEHRRYFLRRYWYGMSVREIAQECGVGEEKVKSALFRTRNKLRQAMEEEGIYV